MSRLTEPTPATRKWLEANEALKAKMREELRAQGVHLRRKLHSDAYMRALVTPFTEKQREGRR